MNNRHLMPAMLFVQRMNYQPPLSRVIAMMGDVNFLSSGADELHDGNLEPVEYEEL